MGVKGRELCGGNEKRIDDDREKANLHGDAVGRDGADEGICDAGGTDDVAE